MSVAPDKLSIVVFSGDFERVHYAFSMAAASAAVDRPATLFFTMEAIRALAKPSADGTPGWMAMPDAARDAEFAERGVATLEALIEACAALDVTFLVCEMGLRATGLAMADLRDDIDYAEGGIVTFLNDGSASGASFFI
jgi:peroxiredoxin family protein